MRANAVDAPVVSQATWRGSAASLNRDDEGRRRRFAQRSSHAGSGRTVEATNSGSLDEQRIRNARRRQEETFDSNGYTLTWNGSISGDGVLTKVGAGTLILGSTNTYAGGTILAARCRIAANDALGSGGVTMQQARPCNSDRAGSR